MRRRAICVVGMHRSGTSMVAGTLQEAGLSLGAVSQQNAYNLKGNREHPHIVALHDRLLAKNGGSWDDPPVVVTWAEEELRVRDRIIASMARSSPWGFKDPRTLFTLDGWIHAVQDLTFVGVFRHPRAVAQSLARRDRFSVEKAIGLWEAYNRRMVRLWEEHPFPLVCFDLNSEALADEITRLLAAIELRQASARCFFEEKLRQMADDGGALPASAAALYARLCACRIAYSGVP